MTFLSNITRSEGDPKVISSGPSSRGFADRVAFALGWFSIGLGVTELVAPRKITQALGMEGSETLLRAYGAREIGSGIVSLSPDKHLGLWSRVAGDGLDLFTLMTAMRDDNPKRDNVVAALAMVGGITLLDLAAAQGVRSRHSSSKGRRRSYRDRTGFPGGVSAARGAAQQERSSVAAQHPTALPAQMPERSMEQPMQTH